MTFRLLLVFGVLVGINVYVFFYSSGSLRVVAHAAETAMVKNNRPQLYVPPPAPASPPRQGAVRDREGLGAALRREGLPAADVDDTLRALRPLLDFKRDLHAGQKYTLQRSADGRLAALELRAGGDAFGVHRAPDGRLLGGRAPLAKVRRVGHH